MLPPLAGIPEPQFAALVDSLRQDPAHASALLEWLREDHEIYHQRGAAAVTRMRGWLLLAVSRTGVSDEVLPFILEELDNGRDAYLVAVAARALRHYAIPSAEFAPFLARSITNIRYHDDLVSLEEYGGYGTIEQGTTALGELLHTVAWMGPAAAAILPEIESLTDNRHGEISPEIQERAAQAMDAIKRPAPVAGCCIPVGILDGFKSWVRGSPRGAGSLKGVRLEDQARNQLWFEEFLCGKPAIVVFFYTRCDKPQRCSLTIAKLARVQKLLAQKNVTAQIRTAAITYDPAFDTADRLLSYGQSRGLILGDDHRMLRTVEDFAPVKAYFRLGVNFIESLVNKHRVEAFILDRQGQVAASFERIQWDEQRMVQEAIALLAEPIDRKNPNPRPQSAPSKNTARSAAILASTGGLSLAAALFPKCPACWMAYLSAFGVAGLEWAAYPCWLLPLLCALMILNLGGLWWRGRVLQRMAGFYLALAGSLLLLDSVLGLNFSFASKCGVLLNLAGSVFSVLAPARSRFAVPVGRARTA